MATENLVPSYLAEIFNRAIPDQLDDNSPFYGFAAPTDEIEIGDSVESLGLVTPPSLYSVAKYGRAVYTSRADLTYSGGMITDWARAYALTPWPTSQLGFSTDGLASPGGLGIWEAGANGFRRGQCDSNTDWNNTNGSGTITIAVDATTPSPYSPQSIKVTTDGTAASQGLQPSSASGQAAAAGTVAVSSIYFKGVAGQSYTVRSRWRNTDATLTDGVPTTFTAGTGAWPTVTVDGVTYEVLTPASVSVATGKTGDSYRCVVAINGTRAESFWVTHAMLQKGVNVVSPYVATSGGATASRTAARVQAPVSLVGMTQGWVAASLRIGWLSSGLVASNQSPAAAGLRQDGSNYLEMMYRGGSGDWRMRCNVGGTATDALIVQSQSPGDQVIVIGYWTPAQIGVSVNGSAFATHAVSSLPAFMTPTFDVGSLNGGSLIDSSVLWFACGTGTPSSADVAYLNTCTISSPPFFSGLTTGAQMTGLVYCPITTPILLTQPA